MLFAIADAVKGSTSEVRQRFIDLQVEQGKQKRVDLLVKAFEEKNNLRKELDKMRPDQVNFDAQGNKVETYSKSAYEARQKHIEKMNKHESKLEKALAGDFNALNS